MSNPIAHSAASGAFVFIIKSSYELPIMFFALSKEQHHCQKREMIMVVV
jgi:hypothetical protein